MDYYGTKEMCSPEENPIQNWEQCIYCMYMQHKMNVQYKYTHVDDTTFGNFLEQHDTV